MREKVNEGELPWKEIPPEDSALSGDEYIYFFDFVLSLREGDVKMAEKSIDNLEGFLNDMCITLAIRLLEFVRRKGSLDLQRSHFSYLSV